MITFPIKRIIGLGLFALGLGVILSPFHSANADWSDPAVQYGTKITQSDPSTFYTTNGNQRLELKTRADIERASAPTIHKDTTVNVNANYMCNWAYDKVLGRYVCEKDYMKAYQYTHPRPVPVCPFGYKLNYGGSDCVRILYPQNAHINARGDGWECNPGFHTNLTGSICLKPEYVYQQCPGGSFGCNGNCANRAYVQPIMAATPVIVQPIVNVTVYNSEPQNEQPKPEHLPQTGPAGLITLALGSIGAGWRLVRRRFSA